MISSARCIFLFAMMGGIAACTQAPTKVRETKSLPRESAPTIRMSAETVIVDGRSRYAWGLYHLPRSVRLSWEDFCTTTDGKSGLLKSDLAFDFRRLAGLGLHPDAPVVVLTEGVSGTGEGGRLAWTLSYFGFKDVQVAPIDYFKKQLNYSEEPEGFPSQPLWEPSFKKNLIISKDELKKVITRQTDQPAHIIDVRTKAEYFAKAGVGASYAVPDVGAINIDWREFFGSNGLPDPKMIEKLKAVGIEPSQMVVVISNRGVRSAAVTMALRYLGFNRAANYAGGYTDLLTK